MTRVWRCAFILATAVLAGCQSPTDADDVIDVDEYVETTVVPDPVIADASTDGKTYNVTIDDVTEKRLYDWKASFSLTARLNNKAADEDLDLTFPVDLTSASFKVDQATGGIRNPPTGGEVEHSDAIITGSTGNRYGGANTSQSLTVDLWYDLPSLRREAIIVATLNFKDTDGKVFTKVVDLRVAP
jgi:hypothetical protein